jgi:AraC-like DNA-binding protein
VLTVISPDMDFVERPISAPASMPARKSVGTVTCFRPRLLSDIVEAIWDCDIQDADFAKALTIKCAPGTSLWLMGQYRTPAEMRQRTRLLPTKCATQIQSHAVTLHPTGALGIVIVCLRSNAANRIVEAPLREFSDASIQLGGLFGAREVATCDDMLAGARTSNERFTGIQSFLLRHLRPQADSLASRAALHLRQDPTMHMHSLAAKLDVSGRHLSRAFNADFGIGPKRFARLARFQKLLSERRNGRSWAQVAFSCGLTDQAHLVKEFQDIVGESPTEFFAHEILMTAQTRPPAFSRSVVDGECSNPISNVTGFRPPEMITQLNVPSFSIAERDLDFPSHKGTNFAGMDEANLIIQHASPMHPVVAES